MEVNYDGGKTGHILLKNLEFNNFYDNGLMNPIKWLKQVELSRVLLGPVTFNAPYGSEDTSRNLGNVTFYIVRQHAEFMPEVLSFLEKLKSSNSGDFKNEVKLTHSTEKILKSSVIYSTTFEDNVNKVLLAKFITYMVLVDLTTRKSKPFPDKVRQFVEKHSRFNDIVQPIGPAMEIAKTEASNETRVYEWSRIITVLDTDMNRHTNNSVYYLLAFECLSIAKSTGFPINLKSPLFDNVVKQYSFFIKSETRIGQTITVKMWKTGKVFHFSFLVLEKEASTLHIEFFD